jgi:Calpain family cysteine protease
MFAGRNVSRLRGRIAGCCLLWMATTGMAVGQAAQPLYGPSGVNPMAVRQGTLGSCYFHAAIAAIAKADPGAIRKAIGGDAKTGYRVHFISGPDEMVFTEDIDYGKAHSYDHSEGEWVTVLMRAYAQRALRENMVQAINRSTVIPPMLKTLALSALSGPGMTLVAYDRAVRAVVNEDGTIDKAKLQAQLPQQLAVLGVTPAEAEGIAGLLDQSGFFAALEVTVLDNGEVFGAYRTLSQGGIPARVLRSFYGAALTEPVPAAALAAKLESVHTGGTAMVARSKIAEQRPTFEGGSTAKAPEWYVPGHAYTVLDYDEANQIVKLRNPWGARPEPNGVFKLPLSAFEGAYSSFSYSTGASR